MVQLEVFKGLEEAYINSGLLALKDCSELRHRILKFQPNLRPLIASHPLTVDWLIHTPLAQVELKANHRCKCIPVGVSAPSSDFRNLVNIFIESRPTCE